MDNWIKTTLLFLAVTLSLALTLAEEHIIGSVGDSVMLKCPLEAVSGGTVWHDWVNNPGRNPLVIYDKNPNSVYLNADRFRVSAESKVLTIKPLEADDYGQYNCKNPAGETYTFKVSVASKPDCETTTASVSEGQEISVTCILEMSGAVVPKISWRNPDGTENPGRDKTDFPGLYKNNYLVQASSEHDDNPFTCVAEAEGMKSETCSVKVRVTYEARELKVSPEKESYGAGEKLTCSAKGNPAPQVTWVVDGNKEDSAAGVSEFTIPSDWPGQQHMIFCEAQNQVGGGEVSQIKSEEFSFTALDENGELPQEPEPEEEGQGEPEPEDQGQGQGQGQDQGLVEESKQNENDDDAPIPDKTTSGSSVGVIGGIVAAVIIIVIIVAVIFMCKRRNKKPKGAKPVPTKDVETSQPNGTNNV